MVAARLIRDPRLRGIFLHVQSTWHLHPSTEPGPLTGHPPSRLKVQTSQVASRSHYYFLNSETLNCPYSSLSVVRHCACETQYCRSNQNVEGRFLARAFPYAMFGTYHTTCTDSRHVRGIPLYSEISILRVSSLHRIILIFLWLCDFFSKISGSGPSHLSALGSRRY